MPKEVTYLQLVWTWLESSTVDSDCSQSPIFSCKTVRTESCLYGQPTWFHVYRVSPMAARNAKHWILAIYILISYGKLRDCEHSRKIETTNDWSVSTFWKKHPLEGLGIFFLKASISFFISRLRLSIKYTNMRGAKTTEGKRSRKSSTVCIVF